MGNQRSCFDRLLQIPNGRLSGRHVLFLLPSTSRHTRHAVRAPVHVDQVALIPFSVGLFHQPGKVLLAAAQRGRARRTRWTRASRRRLWGQQRRGAWLRTSGLSGEGEQRDARRRRQDAGCSLPKTAMRVLLKMGAVRMEEVTCGDAALRVEGDVGEAERCSPQREEERGFRGGSDGEQKTVHIWAAPEPVRSCMQFLIPMFGLDFASRLALKNCEQYKISVMHV
jgi:hypothetical protein